MAKSIKIAMIIIILAAAAGAGLVFYNFKKPAAEPADTAKSGADAALEIAVNPINGRVVGDKMPRVNPFQLKLSPFDAYQNPFRK